MDGVFNISGCALNVFLHFFQLIQLHRAAYFLFHICHVPLSFSQQGAHSASHAGKFLGANDDQSHGTDQRNFGNAKINHSELHQTDPKDLKTARVKTFAVLPRQSWSYQRLVHS